MNKIYLLLSLTLVFSVFSRAQSTPPICEADTVYGSLHEILTVNVLANNFDPDGDSMAVFFNGNGFSSGSNLIIDLGAKYFYGKTGWIEKVFFVKTIYLY